MNRRPKRLGITGRAAPNAAALQLAQTLPAQTLPAAILADLLGLDEDWVQRQRRLGALRSSTLSRLAREFLP